MTGWGLLLHRMARARLRLRVGRPDDHWECSGAGGIAGIGRAYLLHWELQPRMHRISSTAALREFIGLRPALCPAGPIAADAGMACQARQEVSLNIMWRFLPRLQNSLHSALKRARGPRTSEGSTRRLRLRASEWPSALAKTPPHRSSSTRHKDERCPFSTFRSIKLPSTICED